MFITFAPFIARNTDDPEGATPPADPPANDPPPAEPEVLTVPKADWEATQSALADLRRKAKKAEQEAAKAAEDEAKAKGEHEKLAQKYEAERDQIKAKLENERAKARILSAANRLKFRNPDDAIALLPAHVDKADDAQVEAALKQLAADRDYLIDNGTPTRTGAPAGGGEKPTASLDEQLAEAAAKGDWDEHNRLNLQKLAAVADKAT